MAQMTFIFDLDHTVIDSSHRQLTKPDGSLCLDSWRENCTAEKIALDTLLPLADVMRRYYADGHEIVVCTARVCSEHDMAFLERHNLRFHHFISRAADDMRGDADYKSARLAEWAAANGKGDDWRRTAMMFDDNVKVIQRMMQERLWCIDAIKRNKRLSAA